MSSGYKQNLKWANELTYGSTVTVDQPLGVVQSINPTETNNLIKVRTMGGSRDYAHIVPGKFEVSGSFEYLLQGGPFLRMAIGEDTASTATVDSGPRVHTGAALASSCQHVMGSAAAPGGESFPSFTLEFADDEGETTGSTNLHRTYNGCRVNSLTLNATVDAPVSINCDWIAQGVKVSTASATSVSDSTLDPYVFYQGGVTCTSAAIGYNDAITSGDEIAEVNSFDFTINNNLEATWYISGTTNTYQTLRGLKSLLPKGRDYEASLGLHFATKDMYQRFLGSNTATTAQGTLSKYQIVLDFVRTGTLGTKAITDDYIRLVLASCAFNDINIAGSPEDLVNQNIGVAVKDAKVFVVDSDTTYLS